MGFDGHSTLKVLLVSHNHPAHYPGATETYALQLYEAMRESGAVEPVFLARAGFPSARAFRPHLGTPFSIVDGDGSQCEVFSEISDWDALHLTQRDIDLYTNHLRDFLLAHRPDVIHVHSTTYLGVDFLSLAKRALPDTPIVHSLHDYRAICHRDGVMVRTFNGELCDHYSPRRCNECFPEVPPAEFFLRKRFVEGHLEAVDLFLSPSEVLRDRYVEWGVPPERIRVTEFGRPGAVVVDEGAGRLRNRLGFFGELDRHSGITVLLEAMKIAAQERRLAADTSPTLMVHGGDLQLQASGFQQEVRELLRSTSSSVTVIEPDDVAAPPNPMSEVDWVVVPSLWWEGSALVVQDAFRHGKPVICSRLGALEEKVADGVNGIHFRRGDAHGLAAAIRLATGSPELWQQLREGIPAVRSIEEDVESLIQTYRELRSAKVGGSF